MKISFVIPAHNEEKLLPFCIKAIQEEVVRGGHDAEIIVVDNASTDTTGEVARAHNGVKVVYEPRKGLSRARQSGFEISSGDLIANIDADTRMPPGWAARAHRAFEKEKNLVALSGPYHYPELPRGSRAVVQSFFLIAYVSYLLNRFVFNTGSMLQGGNFIIRREALEKIGGFDTAIDFYGEDTDVARRLHKVGAVRWTFNLPMHASARRLKKEGMIRMGLKYAMNHFWILFAKKPWSREYIDVRTDWQGR